MAGTTTAMCVSFKTDMLSALHNFNGVVTPTATTTNTNFQITSVSSLTGIAVGMTASGTGIASGSVVASIDSGTALTLSKACTASGSSITVTFTGDTFKIALVKVTPTGTYGSATTNYTQLTGNSDEVSGTGYTATGVALGNVSPSNPSGITAITTFSPNPSWTSASFSTTGAIIYNTSQRGPTATRAVSVHDFGGTQTVSSGTFTAVLPAAAAGTAILQIA